MPKVAKKNWEKLEEHDLSKLLPIMSELEFQALKADIAENGLKEPIQLFENKILDGRHRFRACKELSSEKSLKSPPTFEDFDGTEFGARQYVASLNMLRRHLSKSQKAMVLVMAGFVAPPEGGGKRRKYGTGREAIMEIGRKYGVNHMTLYKAAYVRDRDLELAKAVVSGRYSVPAAEKIIRDREEQNVEGSKAQYHQQETVRIEAKSLAKELSRISGLLKDDEFLEKNSLKAWAEAKRAIQNFVELVKGTGS